MNEVLRLAGRPLRSRARRYVEREFKQVLREKIKLTSIMQCDERDVFIMAYPKSGSTWLQNLVAGMVYGLDLRYVSDSVIQSVVPGVNVNRNYRRYQTPMFFKAHELPRPERRRIVYLVRDGRDVMVSYYHFLAKVRGEGMDLMQMVRDGEGLYPSKWHEHVEAWLANPYGAEMMVMQYEDLKNDGVHQLRRFCDFAGLQREDNFLQTLYEQSSFQKMREKEVKYGWDARRDWPKEQFFFRRGQVGSYKDEMPADVLQSFLAEAGPALERFGYLGERKEAVR